MGRGDNRPEAARLGLPCRKAGGAALVRFFLQAGGPLKVRQTGNSDGGQDEKRRTEETLICLTVLFPKRKRDERKEATYKSARSEGMPCSREEGATARRPLGSGCPGAR